MSDLSLIPMDDLVKEVEKRCDSFICAYETPEDKAKNSNMKFYYGKGLWMRAVALAAILENDIINNWNGELKTLQRVNENQDEII
jgi:hypothetical protein